MTGQTITEKILARKAGREKVFPGEIIWCKADGLMMHDVTSDLEIDILNNDFGGKIAEGLEIVVVPDHYVPAKDTKSAALYTKLQKFVEQAQAQGAHIHTYMLEGGDYGVCHYMLPEKGHVIPGSLWLGGDSHTCAYGALGAFASGIGSSEGGNLLATGDMWLRVPESMRIDVNGRMKRNVMAKDLFLRVVGDIGVDGALYMAMEWIGSTIEDMPMDERMTLTNMAIEAGAKNGIIVPDDEALAYSSRRPVGSNAHNLARSGKARILCEELQSDSDAHYARTIDVDASSLEPLVAKPFLPSNVVPASELHDIKIHQAYLGSCTGGKWLDFVAAAEVLKGHKVARGVRLLIVPSTADIQRRLVREGLYDVFMDAGAIFSAPTCGACLGGYMGILDKGERCISATNRNFRTRMGHADSEVYLASPKTVAASAIAGYIRGADQ
jgi:3-isopropylmalate/(R)-2-methylmalate dehydratase large subunit